MKSNRWCAAIMLALGGMASLEPAPLLAQSQDQSLLSTFCAASDIQGSVCNKAKGYQSPKACDVKLDKERYSGRFLAAGPPLLVIRYESRCEPHATDFGGSVVFEQIDGAYNFKGYQPGFQATDCVSVARSEKQNRLICIVGHGGQGHLETGVAEMVFTRDFDKSIKISLDFFVTAEDATAAYGSNTVDCKQPLIYFGLSKLSSGPKRDTVSVDIAYADGETIRTACRQGFPTPKEISGELGAGEAYVPTGYEKHGRFVVEPGTRRIIPEVEFGKVGPPR